MNGRRILRRTIDALIHVVHIDLVHDTHMSHSLSHYRVQLRLQRLVVMVRQFQVRVGEQLIARQVVRSELKHVPPLTLSERSRLIAWLSLLVLLNSRRINHWI